MALHLGNFLLIEQIIILWLDYGFDLKFIFINPVWMPEGDIISAEEKRNGTV